MKGFAAKPFHYPGITHDRNHLRGYAHINLCRQETDCLGKKTKSAANQRRFLKDNNKTTNSILNHES